MNSTTSTDTQQQTVTAPSTTAMCPAVALTASQAPLLLVPAASVLCARARLSPGGLRPPRLPPRNAAGLGARTHCSGPRILALGSPLFGPGGVATFKPLSFRSAVSGQGAGRNGRGQPENSELRCTAPGRFAGSAGRARVPGYAVQRNCHSPPARSPHPADLLAPGPLWVDSTELFHGHLPKGGALRSPAASMPPRAASRPGSTPAL